MTTRKVSERATYHHGDLRVALIEAAEKILDEHGIEAFSLRAASRRAGVSPAAPAYHFGDAKGLLTEVAILGFEELTRYLREWAEKGGTEPRERLLCQGEGYVRFALANRARFQLMFRKDKLREDPRLIASSREAFACLLAAVCDERNILLSDSPDFDTMSRVLAAWSIVHGFTNLLLDGQLSRFAQEKGMNEFLAAYIPKLLMNLVPT